MNQLSKEPLWAFHEKYPPEQEDLQRKQELLQRYGVEEFDLPQEFDFVLFKGLSRDWSDTTGKSERIGILRQAELHLVQSHFQNNDGHLFRWTKPDNPDDKACFEKLKRLPIHVKRLFHGCDLSKMMAERCFVVGEIRSFGFNTPVKIQPDWMHVTIDVVTLGQIKSIC